MIEEFKFRRPELWALNRARCRSCGWCRSSLVYHWIISICRPIGNHITLSTYTYFTSPLFETLSTENEREISARKMAGYSADLHAN